eukprot:COSAG02_NODE_6091_length_3809_cov_10.668733_3_plen_107_part_00
MRAFDMPSIVQWNASRPFVAVSLAKSFQLNLLRTCFGAVLMSVAGLPRTIPSESRVGLLQLLLKSGAEASKADDDGYTALHWAAAIGACKHLAPAVVVTTGFLTLL